MVPAGEFEVKEKTEKRTEQESEERKREMANLLVLPRAAESLQNGTGISKKNLLTGSAKKERVASAPQSEQLAGMSEPPLPKRKKTEPSVQIMRCESIKVSKSCTLARERRIVVGASSGKGELYNKGRWVPRRRDRPCKESFLGEV